MLNSDITVVLFKAFIVVRRIEVSASKWRRVENEHASRWLFCDDRDGCL